MATTYKINYSFDKEDDNFILNALEKDEMSVVWNYYLYLNYQKELI
jgi:hypothetical protein